MKDSIILEGKIYISARRAAKIINYSQDYIGQLCRTGKLDCKMVGRSWFVTEESLLAHREQAIDNTQERVLKVIKNNDVLIKNVIRSKVVEKKIEVKSVSASEDKNIAAPATPSESILSPIQATSFKYEAEEKSFLPELKKKVPSSFSLPKDSFKLAPKTALKARVEKRREQNVFVPRIQTGVATASAIQTVNPFTTVAVVVLVALGGFFFTLSLSNIGNKNLSYGNEASVGSAAKELVSEIMRSLGWKSRNPSTLARVENKAIVEVATTTDLNGIGIFPSISEEEDEIAKRRIMNSFSDEVIIKRDQGGTSGVITPVFKKAEGDDFVYVLVPVDEKKE